MELVVLAALIAIAIAVIARRPRAARTASKPRTAQHLRNARRRHRFPEPGSHAAGPHENLNAAAEQPAEPPSELDGFQLLQEEDLDAERKRELLAALEDIPRPPHSLHRLLSPSFLLSSTSRELSDLITHEPRMAAKVLAVTNSSYYRLRHEITTVGHAITFLGLNTIRRMALQLMVQGSFKFEDPQLQEDYGRLWDASLLASEVCSHVAQRLRLTDHGTLSTNVVLSFLGQMAMPLLMQAEHVLAARDAGLLERTRIEQQHAGTNAAVVGSLLMQAWRLPPSAVAASRDILRVLVTPPGELHGRERIRLPLCYACARIGEKLAGGQLQDLATFDFRADADPACYHLNGHLESPGLASFYRHLRAPETLKAIDKTLGALRTP